MAPPAGHTRVLAKQSTLYRSSRKSPKALCNLAPPDPPASWTHQIAKWAQDATIGKTGRLGRPSRLDILEPNQNTRAFILPLLRCLRVWLAVMQVSYCTPRRWSGNGAQDSKICKIARHVNRQMLYISDHAAVAKSKGQRHRSLLICYSKRSAFLARFLETWRYDVPKMA